MRSILLHIHDDQGLGARRQLALDIARQFDSHVTCLQPAPIEASYGDYYGAAFTQIIPIIEESSSKIREHIEKAMSSEDIPWHWVRENMAAYQAIRLHAPLHDLVVLGACDFQGGDRGYSALAADLAINLRTPVLLVDEGRASLDCTGAMMVAWNGSAEAANAMRAAIPLLSRASKVVIVAVNEPSDDERLSSQMAAAYLSRHGVGAEIAEEPVLEAGIAATLQHQAKRHEAELIVMGAYGHTRLHELVLGGVSRTMLKTVTTPLFLAH